MFSQISLIVTKRAPLTDAQVEAWLKRNEPGPEPHTATTGRTGVSSKKCPDQATSRNTDKSTPRLGRPAPTKQTSPRYARSRNECECDSEVDAASSNPATVERPGPPASDLVVLGLGYVGLPLAAEAAAAGLRVVGLDVSTSVVESLNQGVSHIDDLSPSDISIMLDQGFSATTDPACLASARTIVICVPTPLSPEGGPDLSAVTSAAGSIAGNLTPGTLVILESTTYPGTTEEVVRPLLEESGLVAGADFHLAFSPERIDPGNAAFGVANTPKVVGGLTGTCGERAAHFYGSFIHTVVRARGT